VYVYRISYCNHFNLANIKHISYIIRNDGLFSYNFSDLPLIYPKSLRGQITHI